MEKPPVGWHTFSAHEVPWQRAFALKRDRVLQPIVNVLADKGCSPELLSLAGACAAALLPLGFLYFSPWLFGGLYLLQVLLDGLDGSLARRLKQSSLRGAYLDIVADNLPVASIGFFLLWRGDVHPFWVSLFTLSYLLLIVHLCVLGARGTPSPMIVLRLRHPLALLVVLYLSDIITLRHLDLFFLFAGAYYAIVLLFHIVHLRWTLPPS